MHTKTALILIICIVITIFAYKFFKSEKWSLFYYPDGCLTCQDKYIIRHKYKSLNDCRDAADGIRASRDSNPEDTYECGLNCKLDEGIGAYICKETLD